MVSAKEKGPRRGTRRWVRTSEPRYGFGLRADLHRTENTHSKTESKTQDEKHELKKQYLQFLTSGSVHLLLAYKISSFFLLRAHNLPIVA